MIIGISGKKQHGKDTVARILQYLVWKDKVENQVNFDTSIHWTLEDFLKGIPNEKVSSGWETKRFADKVKDIVCLLLGCTREKLEEESFKEAELGEEWKVWFWTNYKYPSPRISHLFATKQEAIDYRINGRTIVECFGTSSTVSSCILTPRLLMQQVGTECGRKIIHPNIWVNATMSEYKRGEGERLQNSYPDWLITDVRFPNEVEAIKNRGGLVIRVHGTYKEWSSVDNHESETSLDSYGGFNPTTYEKGGFDEVIYNRESITDIVTDVKAFLKEHKLISTL